MLSRGQCLCVDAECYGFFRRIAGEQGSFHMRRNLSVTCQPNLPVFHPPWTWFNCPRIFTLDIVRSYSPV